MVTVAVDTTAAITCHQDLFRKIDMDMKMELELEMEIEIEMDDFLFSAWRSSWIHHGYL